MRKKPVVRLCAILFFLALWLADASIARAQDKKDPLYVNPETGYAVYLDDAEGLFGEESTARDFVFETSAMIDITQYGGVALVTARPRETTSVYAEARYREFFGTDSGTLFLIDMKNRYLWIFSDGEIYKTVTKAYANVVADNVYRYATKGDYAACAKEAFDEILALLENRRIAQPMKYINNALLALLTGLSLNFFYMLFVTRPKRPTTAEIKEANGWRFALSNAKTFVISERREYRPANDGGSSSGGGGFSGGGGGGFSGGGGGSSGGGGGHRF